MIVLIYSSTDVSYETNITSFYNGLSSFAWHIPDHCILIIGGDMKAQTGKKENNEFC